jgi:hypothetical protein
VFICGSLTTCVRINLFPFAVAFALFAAVPAFQDQLREGLEFDCSDFFQNNKSGDSPSVVYRHVGRARFFAFLGLS